MWFSSIVGTHTVCMVGTENCMCLSAIVGTDKVYVVVTHIWNRQSVCGCHPYLDLTQCIWLSSIVGTDKVYVVVIHSWN